MSPSIVICILVGDIMCDFHYQSLCFHPEKVGDGQIAASCQVHNCGVCTDKLWQREQIQNDIKYFSSLVALAKGTLNNNQFEQQLPEQTELFDRQPLQPLQGDLFRV